MAMRISNLSKAAACFALAMIWGIAAAGDMMQKESMEGEGKMLEHGDKSMEMEQPDTMKTMEGDMKAMEAEMPMDTKDSMEKHEQGMEKKEGM
ncbi:MAG: hypothetical protein P8103_13035 [Candidatus Thiodiazotropha sp.]